MANEEGKQESIDKQKNVYSYHTFMFPFIWQNKYNSDVTFSEFCEYFENSGYFGSKTVWQRQSIYPVKSDEITSVDAPSDHSDGSNSQESKDAKKKEWEDAVNTYAALQYFCPSAHNSIFDTGNTGDGGVLRTYVFLRNTIHEKAKYVIEKNGTTYSLLVNAIKLNIYDTGIAVLIMECENRNAKQASFAAVKNINEYGRRISLPTISPSFSLCADRLALRWNGQEKDQNSQATDGQGTKEQEAKPYETKFRKYIRSFSESDPNDPNKIKRTPADMINSAVNGYVARTLKYILNYGRKGKQFSTDISRRDDTEHCYLITPALDDRMYVMSLVKNDAAKDLLEPKNGQYAFEETEEFSKSIYEYVFVDPAGGCSCNDKSMRSELLQTHLNRRWLEYGTLYGASQRSFVALGSAGMPDYVVTSFLTLYMQLACLAVACYATLNKFEQEIAQVSHQPDSPEKRLAVLDIRERFLQYQSRLGSNNITYQEQGIELSQMVRDALGVRDVEEIITKRLDALFSATDTRMTFDFNKLGWIIAWLEIVGAVLGLAQIFLGEVLPAQIGYALVTVITWGVLLMAYNRHFKESNLKLNGKSKKKRLPSSNTKAIGG